VTARVRRALICESIEAYDGRCSCPYQRDSRGRACGWRSAWSLRASLVWAGQMDGLHAGSEEAS